MAKPYVPPHETKPAAEKETDLKGTLVSVLLLGLFIVIVWGGVFALYVYRL